MKKVILLLCLAASLASCSGVKFLNGSRDNSSRNKYDSDYKVTRADKKYLKSLD